MALTAAPAGAGEFTVQLCGQQNRTLDGIGGQMPVSGVGDVTESCAPGAPGLTVTPPTLGMPAGAAATVSLRPAGRDAHITSLVLWHDSAVAAAGLQLALTASPGGTLAATPVGAGTLGGADQSDVGAIATRFDLADAPPQEIDYSLRCAGPGTCAGGAGAARLRVFGAALTIDDPTGPTVDPPVWDDGGAAGMGVTASGSDPESGIAHVGVLVDGREVDGADAACDPRLLRPCPESFSRPLTVDTSGLQGGTHTFSVRVVDGAGNAWTTAPIGRPVPVLDGTPTNRAQPAISLSGPGAPRPGETLTATPGDWTASKNLAFHYQWMRCTDATTCRDAVGAEGTTYLLTPDDVGSRLTVAVVAENDGHMSRASRAPLTDVVQPPDLRNRLAPDVAGTLAPGERAVATPGEWDGPKGLQFHYSWLSCAKGGCTPAPGAASAAEYRVRAADEGRDLAVEVTARAGDHSVTVRSRPAGPVRPLAAIRRLLPRPFLRPVVVVHGLAGDAVYRLQKVTLAALVPGSTVEVSCTVACTRVHTVRRVRHRTTVVGFAHPPQLLPGARLVVRVTRPGRIGRIRRITLTPKQMKYSAMRCLAAETGREVRCGGR